MDYVPLSRVRFISRRESLHTLIGNTPSTTLALSSSVCTLATLPITLKTQNAPLPPRNKKSVQQQRPHHYPSQCTTTVDGVKQEKKKKMAINTWNNTPLFFPVFFTIFYLTEVRSPVLKNSLRYEAKSSRAQNSKVTPRYSVQNYLKTRRPPLDHSFDRPAILLLHIYTKPQPNACGCLF